MLPNLSVSAVLIATSLFTLLHASPLDRPIEQRDVSTTCSYVTKPSPAPLLHCNQYGSLTTPDVIATSTVTKKTSGSYFNTCRDACIADAQCISFSIGPGARQCKFYGKNLISQGFKQSSTKVLYANRHCYIKSCTTITTTATTTTTTTTSTTSTTSTISTTSTTSTTSTSTCAPAPTQCGLDGVGWAYIETTNSGSGPDNPENNDFDPTIYSSYTPDYTGVTDQIGDIYIHAHATTFNFYGQYTTSGASVLLNHQGYFYAPQDGDYTFQFSNIDNNAYLWTGSIAYSGYNTGNSLMCAYCASNENPSASVTVTLACGTYYPMRIQWANGGKPGGFFFSIEGPDGTQYNPTSATGNIVQYSCDGTTAPPFPAYGTTADPNPVIGSSCDSPGYSYSNGVSYSC